MGRRSWFVAALAGIALVGCRGERGGSAPVVRPAATPGMRITMATLHQFGGIPPGWKFTPPPGNPTAGRQAFVDLGCYSCHTVTGEQFPGSGDHKPGPDLTGMGGHHPPEYFAEAILNPDAVLVEGSGYVAADGHSTMPSYPDLTAGQLADLVSYLKSLTTGGDHSGMMMGGTPPGLAVAPPPPRPAPPPSAATTFLAQPFDVKAGQLEVFLDWFQREGAERFRAVDGLVSIETFVDATRQGPAVVSVFGFRDDTALRKFQDDPNLMAIGDQFDGFIGPHDHLMFRTPPVYRVPALSTP
jgi:mono/diheme cytochrome c family protein